MPQEQKIMFENDGFVQYEDKTLVSKVTQARFQCKRKIFYMENLNKNIYAIDACGDCYNVGVTENSIDLTFIFGILSQPKAFSVTDNLFVVQDSFHRKYFYTTEGRLANIEFI